MTRKGVLVISALLTAFALVIVGGVVARQTAPAPATANDPAPPAGWQQREAAYQKLIAEANARLAGQAAQPVQSASTQPAIYVPRERHHEHEHEHDDDDD